MIDEKFVEERLQGAVLVLLGLEGLEVSEEHSSQVGDLSVAISVAVSGGDSEAVAGLCWALYKLGYQVGGDFAHSPLRDVLEAVLDEWRPRECGDQNCIVCARREEIARQAREVLAGLEGG